MERKKIYITAACCVCFMLLTGAIFRKTEIMTPNGEPLIDLDSLIVSTETGQEGSSDKGDETTEPVNLPEGEKDPLGADPVQVPEVDTSGRVEIRIKGSEVQIEGRAYYYEKKNDGLRARSIDGFDRLLDGYEGLEVVIVDDYAEAHAYRFILEHVKEMLEGRAAVSTSPDYGRDWGVSR